MNEQTDRELLELAAKAAGIDVVWRELAAGRIDKLGCLKSTKKSGSFPLVDGVSFILGSGSAFEGKNRKEMLMAYGNAIVPQAGAHVIKAFMEYAT